MAKRIAQFHKVSFDKFQEGFIDCFGPVEETRINGRVIGRFWPLSAVSSLMDNQ